MLSIIIFGMTLFIAACGGGGGGGGGDGAAPPPTGPSVESITISGVVSESPGTSTQLGSASIKKQQTQTDSIGNPSEGAHVVIKSFDNNGNLIGGPYETVSTSGGGFNLSNIKIISTGGYITISAFKDGFTTFEKTFTYNTLDDLRGGLQVLAEIDPVLTKVVNLDQWDWTAALGDETISIAVTEDSRGQRQIVSGSEIEVAKASNSEIIWQIDLPRRVLKQQEVESLTVKINNYNPADSNDMRRFPSETDVSGNKLISTGFDYIDIKTNTGESLNIRPAPLGVAIDAASFKIIRQIPDCSLITCDEDTNKGGVQVGFYFLQNGKWRKLGNATLYNPDMTALYEEGTCNGNKPYAVLTAADLEDDIDLTTLSWCNLDYVAAGCDLKEGCITGVVNAVKQDSSREPVKGLYLSLLGNGILGSSYGYTDTSGKYKIDFSYFSGVSGLTLSYIDPCTKERKSKTFEYSDINGCYTLNIDIPDLCSCEVKGRVLKADGTPAPDKSVKVYRVGSGSKGVSTDSNGNYSIPVICKADYKLDAAGELRKFNVNGILVNDINEKIDAYYPTDPAGNYVEMQDIPLKNHDPIAYASAWSKSVCGGDVVQLYGYGYDPDGDPITYNWSDNCGGSFNNTNSQYPKWTAPDVTKTCTITLKVTDSLGASGSAPIDIEVNKCEEGVIINRAPVITNMIVPSRVRERSTVQFGGYAYDPDGDPITYNWSADCGTPSSSTLQNPTWTAPNTNTEISCNITLEVNDNRGGKTTKPKLITVYPNRAPVISGITAPSSVSKGKSVELRSFAYDPDGDPITYNWGATCGSLNNNPNLENPTWTAPNTEATCDITLTVRDSLGASDTETIPIQSVNTPPVITSFNVPDTVRVGDTIILSATATDTDEDTLTYTWFIQGTQVGTDSSYTWKPTMQGTYLVEVKVSDGLKIASKGKNVIVSGETNVDIIIQ
jgi:hypothetical protein